MTRMIKPQVSPTAGRSDVLPAGPDHFLSLSEWTRPKIEGSTAGPSRDASS